jgi:large subunit ribosomal protein L18
MIQRTNKNEIRGRIHKRIRSKVRGTPQRPRLAVFRSLSHIYAQLIDDTKGQTVVAVSSSEAALFKGASVSAPPDTAPLKAEKAEKADKPETEKPAKAAKAENGDKPEKSDKAEKGAKGEKREKGEKKDAEKAPEKAPKKAPVATKPAGGNVAGARLIGRAIASRAKEKGIKQVVFDRGGYIYHGRVKALADAAREAGLEF